MTTLKKINMYARAIQDIGPIKMLVSQGEFVPSHKTNVKPHIVFIREDGWSLGVPQNLVDLAYDLYSWVALIRLSTNKIEYMMEHKVK